MSFMSIQPTFWGYAAHGSNQTPFFLKFLKKYEYLRVFFVLKPRKIRFHFGLRAFVLGTQFACTLCMQILALTSGAWRPCRYKQLTHDCTIKLYVITTLNFCPTFEHRHEIMNFADRIWHKKRFELS